MTEKEEQQAAAQQLYDYAANLMFVQKKSMREARKLLIEEGVDSKIANVIVQKLSGEKQKQANKDMMIGALFCIGGIVATIANLGYVFWGAIVFGAIQFFRGMSNNQ